MFCKFNGCLVFILHLYVTLIFILTSQNLDKCKLNFYRNLKVIKQKLSTSFNVGETRKEEITEGPIKTDKVSFHDLCLKKYGTNLSKTTYTCLIFRKNVE